MEKADTKCMCPPFLQFDSRQNQDGFLEEKVWHSSQIMFIIVVVYQGDESWKID